MEECLYKIKPGKILERKVYGSLSVGEPTDRCGDHRNQKTARDRRMAKIGIRQENVGRIN
jgi:hypothetical protein